MATKKITIQMPGGVPDPDEKGKPIKGAGPGVWYVPPGSTNPAEDGRNLLHGETHEVDAAFANDCINAGRAVEGTA